MPRVHLVKKAAKDNAVVKKGESYYWWKFRHGGKRLSKTYPKKSQLRQGRNSEFYAALEALREAVENVFFSAEGGDDYDTLMSTLEEARDEAVGNLQNVRDEYESGIGNMPDSLQQSPVAETMQEAVDAIDEVISELECWSADSIEDEPEFEEEEPKLEDFETAEDYEAAYDDWEMKKTDFESEHESWVSDVESVVESMRDALTSAVDSHSFPY